MLALRGNLPRHPDARADLYGDDQLGLVIRHSGPVVIAAHAADVVVPASIVRRASRPVITHDETFTIRPNADLDVERFPALRPGHQELRRPTYGTDTRQLPWDGTGNGLRRITRGTPGQWDAAATVDPSQLAGQRR